MRNKRIVEIFETFTKDNLEYLRDYKNTYIKPFPRKINLDDLKKYVKKYDINKFKFEIKSYGIFIHPDKKFIELIKQLDNTIDDKIFFYVTVNPNENNQIDFTEGIPLKLRGLSLSYKIYKKVIDHFKWITSDRFATSSAYNLWYNLLQDPDFYCFTSNLTSGLISKNVSDKELIEIMDKIKIIKTNIELDDELKTKLNSINYKI